MGVESELENALLQYMEIEKGKEIEWGRDGGRNREYGGGRERERKRVIASHSLPVFTLVSFENIFMSLPKCENKWKTKTHNCIPNWKHNHMEKELSFELSTPTVIPYLC